MQSRRQFKAYSIAEPMKREIDETLIQIQMQKRRLIALEREESHLKQILIKKKEEALVLRAKEAQRKTLTQRTNQTQTNTNNTHRTHQMIIGDINTLKLNIDVHRRQISKFLTLNKDLQNLISSSRNNNENLLNEVQQKKETIEVYKNHIEKVREGAKKNEREFQDSHRNVTKEQNKQENQRKKFNATQKSFLVEEKKKQAQYNESTKRQTKRQTIHNESMKKQSLKRQSQWIQQEGDKKQIMTKAVPLSRQRIATMIKVNKEKVKITQNYRKFGQNLVRMFKRMKEYKGRDDIQYIADEFVQKQKQLQQVQQYIGKLQTRITSTKLTIKQNTEQDQNLKKDVEANRDDPSDEHYIALQKKVLSEIECLKQQQQQNTQWLAAVSKVLQPLTQEQLTRTTAAALIGDLDLRYFQTQPKQTSIKQSPKQNLSLIQMPEQKHQPYNQLFSYEKMKELAEEYVKSKKN